MLTGDDLASSVLACAPSSATVLPSTAGAVSSRGIAGIAGRKPARRPLEVPVVVLGHDEDRLVVISMAHPDEVAVG